MFSEIKQREHFTGDNNIKLDEEFAILINYLFTKIRSFEINSHANYNDLVTDLNTRMKIVSETFPNNLKLLVQKGFDSLPPEKQESGELQKHFSDSNEKLDNFKILLDKLIDIHKNLNNKYQYNNHKQLYDSFYNKVRYHLNNNKIHEIINSLESSIKSNNITPNGVLYPISKIFMSIFVEIDIDLAKFIILNKDLFYIENRQDYNYNYNSITTSSVMENNDDMSDIFNKILTTEIIIPDEFAIKILTIFNYIMFIILYNSNNIDFTRFLIFTIITTQLTSSYYDEERINILKSFLLEKEPHSIFTISNTLSDLSGPIMKMSTLGNSISDTPAVATPPAAPKVVEGFVNEKGLTALYVILAIIFIGIVGFGLFGGGSSLD
jgi:hypothetical protein